jgi:hypothetical protein
VSLPDHLVDWLASPDLQGSDGHCLSWWNPRHEGYPYPEISGLLLHLLADLDVAPDRRRQLAAALAADLGAGLGSRRDGQPYTFDTAMAVSGLLAQGNPGGQARTAAQVLVDAVQKRNPAAGGSHPGPPTADTPWSMSFGAHQAKVCGALLMAREAFGVIDGLDEAVEVCAEAALALQDGDGRFRIHASSDVTYLHSHCYALEGLMMREVAAGQGDPSWSGVVVEGARWLALVQQPDGSLRAWHDGSVASGPARTDATAQALRIWNLVDPDEFAEPAGRAVRRQVVAPRGVRYEPGSDDLSSWATIFAVQALSWHESPGTGSAREIV